VRQVKMAVIGAGIWGENHAMALSTYPTVELAWICDLNAERAERLADKVGCRWTRSSPSSPRATSRRSGSRPRITLTKGHASR